MLSGDQDSDILLSRLKSCVVFYPGMKVHKGAQIGVIMKITKLELFKVPPRWLFLKISTDEGYEGWGEPVVEGRADTVKAAVEELSSYLIGANPNKIEDIWQVLYRSGFYRGGPVLTSAISGIEQALWDIKGKYYNAPVYELLGGACRDRIKVYS